MRSFELGYDKNGSHYGVWTGKDVATEKKTFAGIFLRENFYNKYFLSYGQNFYEDVSIPLMSTGYAHNGVYLGLSYSFLGDQQLINPRFSYVFDKNWLNLTQIDADYSVAPDGSYGLTHSDRISRSNTEVNLHFANKKVSKDDDPEYIPGYVYSNINYNNSTRDVFDTHSLRYRLLYGMNNKITANGYLGYSQDNALITQERYYINPSLNIYIKGDKRHGLYLRTNYNNTYSKSSVQQDWNQEQSSTLGLYYNKFNFFVGADIGTQMSDIQGLEKESNIIGVSSGISQDKVSYRASYRRSFNEEAFSDTINGSIFYRPRSDLYLRGRISYKSQENKISGNRSNDTMMFFGLTYLFGEGDRPVNQIIYEKVSSLDGTVYIDKNLNGKKDPDEFTLSGVKVKITKQGDMETTTDSSGKFTFKNFNKGGYMIEVEKEGYTPVRGGSVSMNNYSESVEIGLYQYEIKDIYIKGVNLIDVRPQISCQGASIEPQVEMLSDKYQVKLPKGIACETILDLTKLSTPHIANISKESSKEIRFDVEKIAKVVNFTLEGKRKKISMGYNKKSYILNNGSEVSVIIDDFKGKRSFSVPKGCEIKPAIKEFSFSEIKNNIFYKIICF